MIVRVVRSGSSDVEAVKNKEGLHTGTNTKERCFPWDSLFDTTRGCAVHGPR